MDTPYEYEFHPTENESLDQPKFGDLPRESPAEPAETIAQVYTVPQKRQHGEKAGRLGVRIMALALCCLLLGGVAGAGGMALLSNRGDQKAGEPETGAVEEKQDRPALTVSNVDPSELKTTSEVYASNVNSTVGITTSMTATNYWGYQTQAAAAGSGFIISDDGYILTNYHVIEDADSITVTMYDDTGYDAELIGYDESNDIAVLKIDAQGLPPVALGDSDALLVGDSVVAIGNPLGELTFSLTAGTVSALDRKITMSNGLSMELIQTDCAINSGNSGGALFNLYGEVVGITNAKYSGAGGSAASIDNIGFAIPINSVRDIVTSIIEKGYISRPYIGVSVGDVGEEAQTYGLPRGASVRSVVEDGPSAKAGVKENDIITAVNGKEITCGDDLVKAIASVSAGDELELTVYRQGQSVELKVIVEEKIQQAKEEPEETQAPHGDRQMPGQGGNFDPFSFFFGY